MDNEIKKKFVSELLSDFGKKIDKKSVRTNGNDGDELDIYKLDALPATQSLKIVLRHLGIDKDWLLKNGFVAAAMVLINFKNETKNKK